MALYNSRESRYLLLEELLRGVKIALPRIYFIVECSIQEMHPDGCIFF